MSQDDEETTKYQVKNNNNHYIYTHFGQTKKKENNQQVMPLYENCTITNKNYHNNNNGHNTDSREQDHIVVERPPYKSETFNNDYRFVRNTTNVVADINGQEKHVLDSRVTEYDYENINFRDKEFLDKRILLQKYFRSALVGPRSNIYENLCRGCNYGVCNARGPLCTFCECIVNGVSALRSNTPEGSLSTTNNIYENICEYCGVLYSGTNCNECKCQVKSEDSLKENENILNLGSEELLIEKTVKDKKKVKINKSKSFNKTNKPKNFTNLWGTLRKPKSAGNSAIKKPLEIIHHVEGYEQVFHTKDTFDLKKICELKRSVTSCSDQHIYGRLKQNDLTLSQKEFESTQSLNQSSKSLTVLPSKKPRISKAKFLRTETSSSSIDKESLESKDELSACTIYLNSSVCQWMTSLRREIHAYNTFNEYDQETLCYPKSIPSKNVLISCKAPVTNQHTNNFQNLTLTAVKSTCGDLTEILTLRAHNSMTSLTDSWELQEIQKKVQQPDCYQLMVEEFMANIINKQMLKTKDNRHQIDIAKATMAGVNNNDSYTNNNNNYNIDKITDIPLRQACLTSATTMTTSNHNNNNSNRHKRQGIYMRLEDHPQLQQHNGEEHINLHNNSSHNEILTKKHNSSNQEHSVTLGERVEKPKECNNKCEYLKSLGTSKAEYNTVSTPDTKLATQCEDLKLISRCLKPTETGWDLIKTDQRRRGIHERNVLEAFEALLEQERSNQLIQAGEEDLPLDVKQIKETESQEASSINNEETVKTSLQLQTFGDNPQSISQHFPTQILDVIQLINQQQLATGLNTSIICYDKYLKQFLHFIFKTNTNTRLFAHKIPNKQLVRNFKKFYNYCEKISKHSAVKPKTTMRGITCVSSNLKLDLNVTNEYNNALKELKNNESFKQKTNDLKENSSSVLSETEIKSPESEKSFSKQNQKVKTPPQVPKRDPKTKLSPTTETKRFITSNSAESVFSNKMTVPANNLKTEAKTENKKEEESIYQPIWKFETKGKVLERYRTDDDYYDLKALKEKIQQESPNSEIPKILISDNVLQEEEEDHNNWEPDDEFVFSSKLKKQRSASLTSDRNSTIRSTFSSNSSIGTSSSLSGSTITEFASSTATLASTVSSSLKHNLLRNIGIFYSLTEPKLRAIIYDYDRIHSSRYFAKPTTENIHINDSGLGKSLSPVQKTKLKYGSKPSSKSSTPSTSATSSPVSATKRENLAKISESNKFTGAKAKVTSNSSSSCTSAPQTIPNSVQAWKYQLLDVNYMEDEEDMIVSECEVLRYQQIKDDIKESTPVQQPLFTPRIKSRSTENFLDLPIDDDKKTISERLANIYTKFSPIQRGILNINGRNSPKSEKKAYKQNRASQATSLCLEDGLKTKYPTYPIFGAPLDQLELQQNVPRFVVDAVDYIERKDRIIQDGIYRACGNKFSIDELKQKLTKSYMYDPKQIVADDLHTVTSLLKQFFRDLPQPVIPQEIYSRITANLADKQGIDTIRIAIEEMKEPNKSTLRFLIKHLTNVAACSSSNRMNASNVAIVWGPSLFAQNDTYDMIGRMNTLTKVLIENYDRIFDTNERLL